MGRIRLNKAGVTAQEASLNAVGTKVSDISSQLESARVAVNRCIKSNNTIAIRIRAAQLRISNDSNNILQLRSALATINDKYSSCENKLFLVSNSNELFIAATNIADSLSHFINSDSIGLTPDWIENIPYTSLATLAGLSVSDSYEWILYKLTSGKSNISNIRDLSELGWLFTGNENLQEISKSFKEMPKCRYFHFYWRNRQAIERIFRFFQYIIQHHKNRKHGRNRRTLHRPCAHRVIV